MIKQIQNKIIIDIRDIRKYPWGSVIAGKEGWVFNWQSDYYKIGLITPPILRSRSEELVLNEMLDASEKCYTPSLINEIADRAIQTNACDHYPQKMPVEDTDIRIYCAKHYPSPHERFFCHQESLKGMPKDKWLFTFKAPVPEDGHLAMRVAEEFEKSLMQSSEFRRMVERWRRK